MLNVKNKIPRTIPVHVIAIIKSFQLIQSIFSIEPFPANISCFPRRLENVLQGSLEDVFSVTTSHLSRCLSQTPFKMMSSRCLQDAPSKTPRANMSWSRLEKIVLEDVMKTFWKAIIFYPEDVLKTSLTCLH